MSGGRVQGAEALVLTPSGRDQMASPNVTLAGYAHMFEKTDAKAAAAVNDALAGMLSV